MMWLTRICEEKGARAQAKDLSPTSDYLFGGQVKSLSQDLKVSAELNPLAHGYSYPKKRGGPSFRGSSYRGRGSFRGRGSSARGRAGSSSGARGGSRLSKFKEN